MTLAIVAAVAANGVIGRDGGIPWHLLGDLPRAKRLTMGHVLVMGRRTYDSIGRPLPGRTTVVVTRRADWAPSGVLTAHSVPAALELARSIDEQVFVLGGSAVYRATLPIADRLHLTHVDASPEGDTFFPDVDWARWVEVAREPRDGFTFVDYVRADSVAG